MMLDYTFIADLAPNKDMIMMVIGAGIAGATAFWLVGPVLLKKYMQMHGRRRKDYPTNTVILNQDPRAPCAPSASPFGLKLETYLRMAKIPYEINHDLILGPKGKFPWIEYNGKVIADTQFCIEFLNMERRVDLNRKLTAYQKAQARAFRKLLEEELFWFVALDRFVYAEDKSLMKLVFPRFVLPFVGKDLMRTAHYQGIGRHSKEENWSMMEDDFKALADYMGDNKFLMGDDPCETDCVMFAMLAQIKFHAPGSHGCRVLTGSFPTLVAYIDRMKALVWPDWDDCTTRKGTAKATR